jgi:hypothetical protein
LPLHLDFDAVDDGVLAATHGAPYAQQQHEAVPLDALWSSGVVCVDAREPSAATWPPLPPLPAGPAPRREEPPWFADELLLMHRGTSVSVRSGLFFGDKVDVLVHRALDAARRRLTGAPAAVSPATAAAGVGKRDGEALPPCETLRDLPLWPLGPWLGRVHLRAPAFTRVVLVWSDSEGARLRERWARLASTRARHLRHRSEVLVDRAQCAWVATRAVARAAATRAGDVLTGDIDASWPPLRTVWTRAAAREPALVELAAVAPRAAPSSSTSGGAVDARRHTLAALAEADEPIPVETGVDRREDTDESGAGAPAEALRVRLHLRVLAEVPLPDLDFTFPGAKLRMKLLDKVRLAVVASAGLSVLAWELATGGWAAAAQFESVVVLGVLGSVSLRLYGRYWYAWLYGEHRVQSQLAMQIRARDEAALALLLREAERADVNLGLLVAAGLGGAPRGAPIAWADVVARTQGVARRAGEALGVPGVRLTEAQVAQGLQVLGAAGWVRPGPTQG